MDEVFEKAWPFALIACVLIVVIGGYKMIQDRNQSQVKQHIIIACQTAPDVNTCATQLVKTTNQLK